MILSSLSTNQNASRSPPYIPSEEEHASCRSIVTDLSFIASVSMEISIWQHTLAVNGLNSFLYSSEGDSVHVVRNFFTILSALKLPFNFKSLVAIMQVRSDLCVVCFGMYVVGKNTWSQCVA